MVATQRSTPETCQYCGTEVGDEQSYRRHLRDAHDPSNLGAIDRRRYERYRPDPNPVVAAGGEAASLAARRGSDVAARLSRLRYPVAGEAMARYAMYGMLSSLLVAALLGVGL